ncbi:DASH complex subunit dad2 [Schizosaccharomyces pombe]|uniref:DASH complex subunit dad2 n=1 Tax=Schizosaccharomyces pombe (strain 972 / ATCC 24843) TaxID=284812 RepID=DAD2_SCHPO|nr:DASH complex subunit Dad2 [Schizosaccharomyces pombe]Q9UTG8.1 RecName: Full=DASH complex subunit dad2; AltName: Full=High osmolarity sensitivity protein 2; AltName: Full=Outer kinetochore protein dad2 [Schizosaccharomyces pombe 972h-]CAB55848.1 DASH complex subunit Dad2 [Schizosaccharomyces pombe]|eukprot:NP_593918.1 DASH complex subunit Dad2 [Schizosaccharomyces pombe]
MLQARIEEKQKEYELICKLRDSSNDMVQQIETLAAKLETLTDGSEAVATVLNNWPSIFESIQIASQHSGALVRIPPSTSNTNASATEQGDVEEV